MASHTISFTASEEEVAAVAAIASDRAVESSDILREALSDYLASYAELQADLEEADRQIEAGETISHEEVVAWFKAQHCKVEEDRAA